VVLFLPPISVAAAATRSPFIQANSPGFSRPWYDALREWHKILVFPVASRIR